MKELKKAVSIALILALIINLVIFAAGRIHAFQFWLIIAVAAVVAFFVLPKLKGE